MQVRDRLESSCKCCQTISILGLKMQDQDGEDSTAEICVQILYEGGNLTCDLQCPKARE